MDGWFMFVEIPTADGTSAFRLTSNNTHTVYGAFVWTAASMRIDLPDESIDGSLGSGSIEISNVSRIPLALVEQPANGSQFGELLGQRVTIYLAPESALQTINPATSWSLLITDVVADAKVLKIEAGPPPESMKIPSRIYTRETFPQLLPPQGVRG
jgi:hypothetical protein